MNTNVLIRNVILLFVFLLGTLTFQGCEKNSDSEPIQEIDKSSYEKFAILLRNDLNLIGNVLRKNSFTFANTEAVKISATYVYNEKPEELNAFLNSYNTSKLKSKSVNLDVFDSEVLSVINDIEIGLSNSKGFDDFIQFLEIKFDDVFLSNIERENKEQLLGYSGDTDPPFRSY